MTDIVIVSGKEAKDKIKKLRAKKLFHRKGFIMGFRINTNIAAMNAHRNATQTNVGLNKSLTALSSGLRINRAADDASGMAIADSLRQQSEGLGQAIKNSNDAIGVAQTADGALDEYTKIIDTVRTKAIQAASDGQTLDSRKKIQADIDRLTEEAQNIASSTSFNGQTLLNGSFKNRAFHIGAYAGESVKLSINNTQTSHVGKFALAETTVGFGSTSGASSAGTATLSVSVAQADGTTKTVSASISVTAGEHDAYAIAQSMVDAINQDAQTNGIDVRASLVETTGSTATAPEYGFRLDSASKLSSISLTDGVNDGKASSITSSASVGLTNNLSAVDVTTRRNAEKAVITADYALKDVDKTRSDIGSVQNQLESTIRNISTTQVNVSAAESQIRDVDFAAESANFSKLNILSQSGTYAMSQANAVQKNVLRLLQ